MKTDIHLYHISLNSSSNEKSFVSDKVVENIKKKHTFYRQ